MLPVSERVCKDLVLYDEPRSNPFRALISWTQEYVGLRHIIVAVAALHASNSSQMLASWAQSSARQNPKNTTFVTDLYSQPESSYRIALHAKHQALAMLRSDALKSFTVYSLDVVLAIVLLFIEFELINSGLNDWAHHIKGARPLIRRAYAEWHLQPHLMTDMRRCLIANCLVYVYVLWYSYLGSSLTTLYKQVRHSRNHILLRY
jgi:hypothetical protein